MTKQTLLQEMINNIPEDLRNMLLTAKIKGFPTLDRPTTEEEANIVVGQFCADVQNNLLVPLSGLPVVAALLYIGSLNPGIFSSAVLGMESLDVEQGIQILTPIDKQDYRYEGSLLWPFEAEYFGEPLLVTASIDGTGGTPGTIPLSLVDGRATGHFQWPASENDFLGFTAPYTISVVADYGDTTHSDTVYGRIVQQLG